MASHRPYRAALGIKSALEEKKIEKNFMTQMLKGKHEPNL
jgi:hypothetical protein